MKAIITGILLFVAATMVNAQQHWYVGANYDFYFDNLEASGCEINESGTVFGARLKPYLSWQFDGNNRLTFGVDMLQNFGEDVKFCSDIKPMFYYTYSGSRWTANAGIFPRTTLQGAYGEHIMAGSLCFTDDLLSGLCSTYKSDAALWEVAVSWDGMHSESRRELFRIYSSGHYDCLPHLHVGYDAKMTHLANSTADEGVVDYIVMSPYVGTSFAAWADWTLRAHCIISIQRDRNAGQRETPLGAQFDITVQKWGFTLHNELYLGDNQMPFYAQYGHLLYLANENYGTRHHLYNHTGLDYNHSLFDGRLEVGACFEMHYGRAGVSVQQVLSVKVNLEHLIGNCN